MTPAGHMLDDARALVARGWCQRADARRRDGAVTKPWCDDAVAWSVLGALVACLERRTDAGSPFAISDLALACTFLAETIDSDSLEGWNDAADRTHGAVLDALAHAAYLARTDPVGISLS